MLSMGDGLIKYHPFNLREHCRLIVFLPLLSLASISTQKVVSIGHSTAFYVVLVPMKLIPSEPPHFAYVIILAKRFHFLASRFYKTIDILMFYTLAP